jgi:hypothetical protein
MLLNKGIERQKKAHRGFSHVSTLPIHSKRATSVHAIAGMGMTEGVLGGHALRTRLPLQVREHTHSAFHMLRGHNDDFSADAVEFQIDPGVIERQVADAE